MAIKRFKLMPDPHTETGAQDTFCLTKMHFQCDMSNVVSVRFILQQPSPLWKDFKLEELKLFRPSNGTQACSLPACILEDLNEKSEKKELEGVPEIDVLSSGLQQLWALAEEAVSNQTKQSLGRYDVDGCYDINLLSYT
uniref:Nicolin-1 n=1 Tax=Arion vulgaris TaxID=1028688 RepID=A0A0B6ZZT0_9EUPU